MSDVNLNIPVLILGLSAPEESASGTSVVNADVTAKTSILGLLTQNADISSGMDTTVDATTSILIGSVWGNAAVGEGNTNVSVQTTTSILSAAANSAGFNLIDNIDISLAQSPLSFVSPNPIVATTSVFDANVNATSSILRGLMQGELSYRLDWAFNVNTNLLSFLAPTPYIDRGDIICYAIKGNLAGLGNAVTGLFKKGQYITVSRTPRYDPMWLNDVYNNRIARAT